MWRVAAASRSQLVSSQGGSGVPGIKRILSSGGTPLSRKISRWWWRWWRRGVAFTQRSRIAAEPR